jgi:enterochelin esterase family protein
MPYVEQHYRVLPGRTNRAIAGLSMGGDHTLRIGLPNLDKFAYLGVFSSGLLGAFNLGPAAGDSAAALFARQNAAVFADPKINEKIKVLWLSTGSQDFIMPFTKATLTLFDAHHIKYSFTPSEGGHTWPNWRAYLNTFVPLLFR